MFELTKQYFRLYNHGLFWIIIAIILGIFLLPSVLLLDIVILLASIFKNIIWDIRINKVLKTYTRKSNGVPIVPIYRIPGDIGYYYVYLGQTNPHKANVMLDKMYDAVVLPGTVKDIIEDGLKEGMKPPWIHDLNEAISYNEYGEPIWKTYKGYKYTKGKRYYLYYKKDTNGKISKY